MKKIVILALSTLSLNASACPDLRADYVCRGCDATQCTDDIPLTMTQEENRSLFFQKITTYKWQALPTAETRAFEGELYAAEGKGFRFRKGFVQLQGLCAKDSVTYFLQNKEGTQSVFINARKFTIDDSRGFRMLNCVKR